jgi:hypothetical protein
MNKKKGIGPLFGPDGYEDTPLDVLKDMENAVFVDNDGPTPEEMKRAIWTPYYWFHKNGTVSVGIHAEKPEDTK